MFPRILKPILPLLGMIVLSIILIFGIAILITQFGSTDYSVTRVIPSPDKQWVAMVESKIDSHSAVDAVVTGIVVIAPMEGSEGRKEILQFNADPETISSPNILWHSNHDLEITLRPEMGVTSTDLHSFSYHGIKISYTAVAIYTNSRSSYP